MKSRSLLLVSVLVLTLALAACSAQSTPTPAPQPVNTQAVPADTMVPATTMPTDTMAAATAPTTSGSGNEVTISNYSFGPTTLTVASHNDTALLKLLRTGFSGVQTMSNSALRSLTRLEGSRVSHVCNISQTGGGVNTRIQYSRKRE